MASVSRKISRNIHSAHGTAPRGLANAEVAVALYDKAGHVAQAAKKLGVAPVTVYRKIGESRELQILRAEINAAVKRGDFGQASLRQMMYSSKGRS